MGTSRSGGLIRVIGICYTLAALLISCASQADQLGRATTTLGTVGGSDPSSALEAANDVGASPQALDSVASTLIPATGGIAELPGFASVRFADGAFDSTRAVTIAATSDPEERSLFKLNVGMGSAAHGIRILTGSTPPANSIEIVVKVPAEFLDQVPPNKVPVVFGRARYVGPMEVSDGYVLIQSEFDEKEHTVRARVRPGFFEECEVGKGMQAVLVISSAIRR